MAEHHQSPNDYPERKDRPTKGQKNEEKKVDEKAKEAWLKPEGDLSEVVDSEGHRIHLNRH